nr:MAG TPA: hypothetical protein [Herelleviridae sp.]
MKHRKIPYSFVSMLFLIVVKPPNNINPTK